MLDWVELDDGSGPAVYAAVRVPTRDQDPTAGIVARFDGHRWERLGPVISGLNCLAVHDDGTGPKLHIGGFFRVIAGVQVDCVARWTGGAWDALPGGGLVGANDLVSQLISFDAGAGPVLHVGGRVTPTGSTVAKEVLRRTSAGWVDTGTGLETRRVRDFIAFDDGTGPGLFATAVAMSSTPGGLFKSTAAGWVRVPLSPSAPPDAVAVFDAGLGPRLYLGGSFLAPGSTTQAACLVAWDGSAWTDSSSDFTPGPGNNLVDIWALAVHDDGSGPALHVTGDFVRVGGFAAAGLARWNGTTWSAPFGTLRAPFWGVSSTARLTSLASLDDGTGRALFVGGSLAAAGNAGVAHAAKWASGAWSTTGTGQAPQGRVESLEVFDDGSGTALYASGYFENAGSTIARCVARWNGANWSALGAPQGTDGEVIVVKAVEVAGVRSLYAGGSFRTIGGTLAGGVARWNGSDWESLGGGGDGLVYDLIEFDDGTGPALIATGAFSIVGGVPASNIAKWNGSSWSALGIGLDGDARVLAVYDRGTGPVLHVGGYFAHAGGQPALKLASWDGASWNTLGLQPGTLHVLDMAVADIGNGPVLMVAGTIRAPGLPTSFAYLQSWDGSGWAPVSLPILAWVYRVGVADFGRGPQLWATQNATTQSPGSQFRFMTWDPLGWSSQAVCGGLYGWIESFALFDDGTDGVPDAYIGGGFGVVDDLSAHGIARFDICGTQGTIECPGDGTASPCPCGNFGAIGHGCASSVEMSGGALATTGLARLGYDTLRLLAEPLPNSTAIFLQGTGLQGGLPDGIPFGDGLLCAGGTLVRLGTRAVSGGTTRLPTTGGRTLSELGQVTTPGTVLHYQCVYRNSANYCTAGTLNTTNGLSITWGF